MFILPLEKSIDWKKPPVVTVLLIIANTLILFFGPDGSLRHEHWVMEYGFIPAQHQPITFLTHAFLHGGLGHLLGNMIFLFLIGFAVETALGSWLYLAFYLLAGQSAVLLFWLLNADSTIPLVGASGCIAGLMGLYAGLFGLRKIRFFYSILFYFGYANAPAIILLPMWVLNEYYQLRWGGDSQVAYVAHIGGLVGGGVLGVWIKSFDGKIDKDYLDASEKQQARTRQFEQGMAQLKALEIDKAYTSFKSLVDANPQDYEALSQLCKVAKFKPKSPNYQRVTEQVLRLPANAPIGLHDIHEVYLDYRRLCAFPLASELLISLAIRFGKGGYMDTAEGIAQHLLHQGYQQTDLADCLLALAAQLGRNGKFDKQQHYLELLAQHFPQHEAARHFSNG